MHCKSTISSVQSLSQVRLLATPWAITTCQANFVSKILKRSSFDPISLSSYHPIFFFPLTVKFFAITVDTHCNCISLLTSLLSRPLVTFQSRQWLLIGTSLSCYFKHDTADQPVLPETLSSTWGSDTTLFSSIRALSAALEVPNLINPPQLTEGHWLSPGSPKQAGHWRSEHSGCKQSNVQKAESSQGHLEKPHWSFRVLLGHQLITG